MQALSESYKTRPIGFLSIWEIGAFRMKAYGISFSRKRPGDDLVDAARHLAEARLQESAEHTNHYGVGFVGIHEGKTGNFVFVDWWTDENELHHHIYVSSREKPNDLEYRTPSGLAACVWDLALISFERKAWIENVLNQHEAPDLDGYLAETLTKEV